MMYYVIVKKERKGATMNTKYQLTIAYSISDDLHMVHKEFWLDSNTLSPAIFHFIHTHEDISIDSIEVNAM